MDIGERPGKSAERLSVRNDVILTNVLITNLHYMPYDLDVCDQDVCDLDVCDVMYYSRFTDIQWTRVDKRQCPLSTVNSEQYCYCKQMTMTMTMTLRDESEPFLYNSSLDITKVSLRET